MNATARANLYAFFSRVFISELDDEAVSLVCGPLGQNLLPEFNASEEVAIAGDPERRNATLDADYVHLTVVNVVPYASFYLREDAMVASGAENGVTDFLNQYGFEVDLALARSLSQDHIGIVLEAMSILCAAEAEALARPDLLYVARIQEVQRAFLAQHVVNWAPLYFFAAERCAHTTLYREAARVAMDYVASDYEDLCRATQPADAAGPRGDA